MKATLGHRNNPPEVLQPRAKTVELPAGDLMQALLDRQRTFEESLRQRYPDRYGGPATLGLREQVLMTFAELDELQEHLPPTSPLHGLVYRSFCTLAKLLERLPWKKHKRDFARKLTEAERTAAVEETIDLLHFIFNIFLHLGVGTSEEIYRLYVAKNEVNHQRQADGY